MISLLEQLDHLINLAEGTISEDSLISLDEKIMSKKRAKALKKKKLRAKQQKQQAQQSQQTETDTDVIDAEVVEDDENTEKGTQLIVYDEKIAKESDEDIREELTEEFKQFMALLNKLLEEHRAELAKADNIWKMKGDGVPCPAEAWDIYNAAINTLKQKTDEAITQCEQAADKMAPYELQTIDIFLTAIDGYLQKASQEIIAIKPNLSIEELNKGNQEQENPEIEGTKTLLLTDKSQPVTQQTDDKRTRKTIMDYKTFNKQFGKLNNALLKITEGIGKALKSTAKTLAGLAGNVLNWFDNIIWGVLTSPIAKDALKTFMYSNPITMMIFNGDFGKITIGDKIAKIRDKYKEKLKGKKPNRDPKTQLPKDINNMKFKELKKEFYGNKALIDLVNVSYNHPKVTTKDKAELKKYSKDTARMIKLKKPDEAKNSFSALLKTCNRVCDYMDWDKAIQWQNLVTKYIAKGTTEKEEQKIKNSTKKKVQKPESENKQTIAFIAKDKTVKNKTDVRDSLINRYGKSAAEADSLIQEYGKYIDSLLAGKNPQESYNTELRKMYKLLNEAIN